MNSRWPRGVSASDGIGMDFNLGRHGVLLAAKDEMAARTRLRREAGLPTAAPGPRGEQLSGEGEVVRALGGQT